MPPTPAIGVVGATSWGTTLAVMLARRGADVRLWARSDAEAADLAASRQNRRFLPGVPFPAAMSVTASAQQALADARLVIFAVPSQSLRANARRAAAAVPPDAIVVSAAKGLETTSGKRMSQALAEELPPSFRGGVCALSGPNLSREVIAEKPASTVIASSDPAAAKAAQDALNAPRFRAYTNDDIIGVEFCGALKNVIALAAGVCDGLEYGDNAKAALITRGLAEIARLSVAAGANPLTAAGLAGMGDLIATCSSPLSRNLRFGRRLAQGEAPAAIRASMSGVAEGVDTTPAAVRLADKLGVEMPIAQAMQSVLFGGVPPETAAAALMERAPRPE